MSDYDNAIFRLATAQEAEPEDYTGEDGLLYCGSCRQPKEAYYRGEFQKSQSKGENGTA